MRVLYIYTLFDHIFPYIIGLLSYIRVIIQDIVRNHQHPAPARLCVSNIQHTTYSTYYCSMRHIWTPPSESDERAPVWHRLGPSVGYRKEAVGHTDARSPPAAAATSTAALCSSRAASHTRTFGSRIGTFTSGWRRPTGCSYDRVWSRSESCGLGVRVGVACPNQPRPPLHLQRVFRVKRPPPPTVSDARSAPPSQSLHRTA